jgi:hypothetical protein
VPCGEGSGARAGAGAELFGWEPSERAGEIHNRGDTRDAQGMPAAIAGATIYF